jgi:hypothetical protein
MRFQSARDLAFGLEVLSNTSATATSATIAPTPRRWWTGLGPAVIVLGFLAAIASCLRVTMLAPSIDNPLMNATFTPFTNFEGSELDAAISPDGRFVAFMADHDGPFHVWLKQVGTGPFVDLTPGEEDQRNPGPNRSVGFSGRAAPTRGWWVCETASHPYALCGVDDVPRTIASTAMAQSIQGTATYRERMTLPPAAVFEAALEDVSRADSPADSIARTRVASPGNPPIAF